MKIMKKLKIIWMIVFTFILFLAISVSIPLSLKEQATDRESHQLSKLMMIQGGLSSDNISDFQNALVSQGVISEANKTNARVKIVLEDEHGVKHGEYTPEETPAIIMGEKYLDGKKKIMKLVVEVPIQSSGVAKMFPSKPYLYSERVLSLKR
ncbi:hypothetical protein JMA_38220 (plasmid) [Jeotgalibacillus malaysiensis]|uniref:Uncharacterized protein n=1 Tax=Jeotgalibacillus malaysiensis TaxID=1508404 RepID=A0A0B5ASC9_9BACL|nr:hypothetical protein [Jeotgalibacillus malaysiensis]AJD93140.1 hypothetical protein JMA_38220 [Jeotgalibacillus malaysiensis]